MSDSVTVRSSQSWFSRIGGAIAGVLIGIILFIAAFPLLGWNEGRAIKRAKTLDAGGSSVISVPAAPIDPAHDGKLVHITGPTVAGSEPADPAFGLAVSAIKLRRDVEMYQWTEEKKSETQKKLGGSEETVTTYTYKKEWSSGLIDSSEFHKPDGHTNPGELPVESETFTADGVTVGDYTLPDSLIEKIEDYHALPITKKTKSEVTADLPAPVTISNDGFFVGQDPKAPAVGNLRIHFEVVEPGDVSIVAAQTGTTFEPYIIEDLGTIELLQAGTFSAKSMFATEQQGNVIVTWLVRLLGFIIMFFGLLLIMKPLSVLADIIPLLGTLAETGTGLLSFLIALPLTLLTIALAWLAFRPLLGIPLLLLVIGTIIFAIRILLKKKASRKDAAAAA